VTTIIKKRVDLKKTVNYKGERVEFYTRARAQKNNVWLDRLSFFLCGYILVTYYWATFTNTGVPWAWVLCVVFPSVGIYLLFKWLWSK